MPVHNTASNDVVSAKVYRLILESKALCARLLPEGPSGSPYEILDYEATLVLDDPQGRHATFRRKQTVRFLQDGVSAILDHFWGDGVQLAGYQNSAGLIGDSFRDGGKRHVVIELPHVMGRGDTLTFEVERQAMIGFTAAEEWLETTIDHPIHRLNRTILFPSDRPCQNATLVVGETVLRLQPRRLTSARTYLSVEVPNPRADNPYTIHWSW